MTDATEETNRAQERAKRARVELGETIDALKQKMSVGEIVDELRSQFLPDGSSQAMSRTVSNLTNQVQSNPMALALIGAGVAWLMMSGNDKRSSSSRSSGRHTTDGMMGSASASVSHAAQATSDAASRAGQSITETAEHAYQGISDSVGRAEEYVSQTSEDMLERYPLVFGAAAVAVGAAIGAALPATSFENRQMGEASDRLKETAGEQGREAYEQVSRAAHDAYDRVSEAAEQQGSTGHTHAGAGEIDPSGELARPETTEDLGSRPPGSRPTALP